MDTFLACLHIRLYVFGMSNEETDRVFCGDALDAIAERSTEVPAKTEDGTVAVFRLAGIIGFTKEELEEIARKNGGCLPLL